MAKLVIEAKYIDDIDLSLYPKMSINQIIEYYQGGNGYELLLESKSTSLKVYIEE